MILMISCPEIDDYLAYYEQAPNAFNLERKLLIENIVKPTLKRTDVFFDKEMYYKCLEFCKTWYYEFIPWEKFVASFIFIYDKNDMPLFKTFVIIIGRGNGKDGFIMPIAHFLSSELYGIKNYNIDIIANSEDQSMESYEVIYEMLEANKNKMRKHFVWNKEKSINISTRSRIQFLTSSSKTGDGKKPGAIIYNEYHAYTKGDKVNVSSGGLGKKRHPRSFIITSNGLVRDGQLDELIDTCMDILNGEENILRYFPFICKIDDKSLVDNPEYWIQANPSLDYMPILRETIMMDYYEMKKIPSKRAEFMAKRMNLPEVDDVALVTTREFIMQACFSNIEKKIERECPKLNGQRAVLGIDYASLNDFASAGFLIKKDNEYIWRQHTWICAKSKYFEEIKFPFAYKGMDGYNDFEIVYDGSISEDAVMDWVEGMMRKLNVQKIRLDNYKWQLMKKAFLSRNISLESKEDPDGLVSLIRYPASIAAIVGPDLEVLFADKRLNLGNSAMMRWAINNTYMKDKKDGNKYFEKVEPKLRKNDPFMALVCAVSIKDLLDEEIIYV